MKTNFRIRILIEFLILVSLAGVTLTHAQGNQDSSIPHHISSLANLPWSTQYVQQELYPLQDVGRYVSMALRPLDDLPVISYYDATNGNLMIAYPVLGHSGNCGSYNNWMCLPLDGDLGDADVGKYASIDLWGETADSWKLGISYYDATAQGLKAIVWTCSYANCNPHIIEIATPVSPSSYHGLSTSIKFNSAGVPTIAYYSEYTLSSDWLMYAYPVDSGGNCGGGDDAYLWQCDGIDYGDRVGQFASLDISWDDIPYIAYYDAGSGDLKYAYHASPSNCGVNNDWICSTINFEGDVGLYTSLKAPQSSGDLLRIAYYDKTDGQLKYYDSAWNVVVVDDMSNSLEPMGVSLTIDNNGYPIIAYQQISSEFSPPALQIARPYLAFNDGSFGNCGNIPPGYQHLYWRCNTLDNGGQYTEEADFASIVIDSRGLVGIAYSEYDSDLNVMSLKFIYQHLLRTFMPITNRH